MSFSSNAVANNSRLFPPFARKLAQDDLDTYAQTSAKLAAWLRSDRAYYTEARPEIVTLLTVAHGTFQRAAGLTPNTASRLSAFLNHPMARHYCSLLDSVRPHQHLFTEPELQAQIQSLLATIVEPGPSSVTSPEGYQLFPLMYPWARYSFHARNVTKSMPVADAAASAREHTTFAQPRLAGTTSVKEALPTSAPEQEVARLAFQDNTSSAIPSQRVSLDISDKPALTLSTHVETMTPNTISDVKLAQSPSEQLASVKKKKKLSLTADILKKDLQAFGQKQVAAAQSRAVSFASNVQQDKSPATTIVSADKGHETLAQLTSSPPISRPLGTSAEKSQHHQLITSQDQTIPGDVGAPISGSQETLDECLSNKAANGILRDGTMATMEASQRGLFDLPLGNSSSIQDSGNTVSAPSERPSFLAGQGDQRVSFAQTESKNLAVQTQEESMRVDESSLDVGKVESSNVVDADLQSASEGSVVVSPTALPPRLRTPDMVAIMSKVAARGDNMHIIAVLDLPRNENATMSIRFQLTEEQCLALNEWNRMDLERLDHAVCLTMACYASDGDMKDDRSNLASAWPESGGLYVSVSLNGKRGCLPLSPPLKVSHDGLVDISPYTNVGLNTIELKQRRRSPGYTFVLRCHPPTPSQLEQRLQRFQRQQEWDRWRHHVSRLDITPGLSWNS